jgi:hypothetical protein
MPLLAKNLVTTIRACRRRDAPSGTPTAALLVACLPSPGGVSHL